MAPGLGKNFTRLIKDIQKHYGEYSVFYAIFLCEMLLNKNNPQRDAEKLDQEDLNFRPYENYVYPPSDIRSFSYDGEQIQFVLNFLGLYGINAPLPRCYHEQVAIQQEVHGSGDIPLQNFLDIFDNRFYWLYYQAWKKYRYYLQLSDDPDNKTMRILRNHEWKGGIRELENVIERALILCEGDVITPTDLPPNMINTVIEEDVPTRLKDAVAYFEREHIKKILQKTGINKEESANILGISLQILPLSVDL